MAARFARPVGLGLTPAAARTPAWSGAEAGPRVSVIEIPLSISLPPLFRRADALLPREVGHWRGWHKQYGIETRYRAWWGPLRMAFTGNLLQVEAHVRYWAQGRKQILGGFDLEAAAASTSRPVRPSSDCWCSWVGDRTGPCDPGSEPCPPASSAVAR